MSLKDRLIEILTNEMDTLSAEEQNILVDTINKLHEVESDKQK